MKRSEKKWRGRGGGMSQKKREKKKTEDREVG